MGNIRQTNIKNVALRLVENYGNTFTEDFDANKHLVTKYTTIESKVIRNRVAGYVTRKMTHKPKE
ncbi:30S ribosomal protein S17e [Methanolobus halotolerans]|uniref:Small ribosomal subunit protein eS17 n=1 Tax=Methanolobus halotolerans TaxID=2052935 RepID=A0A4E0PWL4_9EURY|nr:30S ribosomal protein S17e [Methanolobus halotolerans]TGC09781.1 30S ribosomal protein S17e [Methanolobus halotolerans]